jgi:hypothetical protein
MPGMEKPERPLRNPFRSEADAFRLLVIIGLGVAAIVVAAELGGAWAGVPVAVVLVAAAARATFRWLRAYLAERDPAERPAPR